MTVNQASRTTQQDERYRAAIAEYGAALARLARAYEAGPELRRDLLQEIHIAIWRSFESFDGRCSVRTWIYRVAHNVATSHAIKQRRGGASQWISLDDVDLTSPAASPEDDAGERQALDRLLSLIHRLEPLDRQLMLSYLEGLDAEASAQITGLSASNVATRIHRIKKLLTVRFFEGVRT